MAAFDKKMNRLKRPRSCDLLPELGPPPEGIYYEELQESWWRRVAVLLASVLAGILAHAWTCLRSAQYVITNDDPGVSFYTVSPDGLLTLLGQVQIGGFGNVAGFFGTDRIGMLNSGGQQCAYASVSSTGEISGIAISTLTVGGSASGSPSDNGSANGIGLALNSQYLYASFTASNTIGTFQIQPGCSLTFVNDVSVSGLAGGLINGMAIHANIMVTTFTDGSIESFDISHGHSRIEWRRTVLHCDTELRRCHLSQFHRHHG